MLAKWVGVGAAILVLVFFGRWTASPKPLPIVRSVQTVPRSQAAAESAPTGSSAEIRSDLATIESEIRRIEEEDKKYSGGLVKALIGSELHILQQTRAMLQQRATSWTFGIGLSFQVNGKPYIPPANAPELLGAVEQEIAATRIKLASAEAEADRYSGGLIQALSMTTVATMRNSLAMLEQKRLALKYGLPQYVAFRSDEQPTNIPQASAPLAPTQGPQARRWSIVEVDSRVTESNDSWWRFAWKLTIRNESTADLTFNAIVEFQDADGFVIDSDNAYNLPVAAMGDRTFTGYALVRVPGASRVTRTNAKVSPKN